MVDSYKRKINEIYYQENKERLLEKQKIYNYTNKEKYNEYQREYRRNNRVKYTTLERSYILHKMRCKKDNVFCDLSFEDVDKIFDYFNYQCVFCSDYNISIGYIISRKYSGGLTLGNVIPICPSCRSSKKNLMLDDWNNWVCMDSYSKNRVLEYMRKYK